MLRTENKTMADITVEVTQPVHLCAVQIATRQFCRAIEFNEGAVFDAVIGVSEFAHRMLVEKQHRGAVKLSATKVKSGYALEAQVTMIKDGLQEPCAPKSLTFSDLTPRYGSASSHHLLH